MNTKITKSVAYLLLTACFTQPVLSTTFVNTTPRTVHLTVDRGQHQVGSKNLESEDQYSVKVIGLNVLVAKPSGDWEDQLMITKDNVNETFNIVRNGHGELEFKKQGGGPGKK